MRKYLLAAPIAFAAMMTPANSAEDRDIALPDYRADFVNYMISDRLTKPEQVMSFWGNDIAREAARAGEALPDGSVLIGEIYGAKKDADGNVMTSELDRRIPEELKVVLVMERKAEWADQYEGDMKVGGWEFEVYNANGENLNKDTTACRECHAPMGDNEYTWSLDHLAAAN